MPLQPRTRIGGYEIVALIGAGGMGEVYRARDLRLGRDVALKTISPRITADAEAIARFEREARALASLNHPNIAAIYGVEDNGSQPALILELVDGETLADRIARGPVAPDHAIEYARQIADALDVAHESGIVHRDLKPGNIKITDDGRVKVLDFGLAKAIAIASGESPDVDPANSPTVTVHGTHSGVILGTAAYMSPEQARGKRIDKRTDIWAFGCVLFEMLTGKRAFNGETSSDVIAAIIERTPNLDHLPASTPPHVRRIILRCLEKDPKRRVRDIADVRVALDDQDRIQPAAPPSSQRTAFIAAALVITLFIGVAAWYELGRRESLAPRLEPSEFTFSLPTGPNIQESWPAVSPDGRRIAIIGRGNGDELMIFLRNLHSTTPVLLPGTEGVAGQVFWSPDGRHLGFRAGGRLKRVPADGGPVQIICPLSVHIGATWGKDDIIVVAAENRGGLSKVAATGGTLQPITKLDPAVENSHRWPHFLPDGRHFIFTVRTVRGVINNALRVGSLDSDETTQLVESQSNAAYSAGYLLFVKDGTLLAQPFDAATRTLSAAPRAIAGGVRQNMSSASAAFSASADGSVLAYLGGAAQPSRLIWFDRAGKVLSQVGEPRGFLDVVLSHDEKHAVFDTTDSGSRDVWVVETSTGAMTRITNHPATDWWPFWSPDDRDIAFASDRAGQSTIFKTAANGSGDAQQIYRGDIGVFGLKWLKDGRLLFFRDIPFGEPSALLAVPIGRTATPETVLNAPSFRINDAELSPDGQLIAYTAVDPSRTETYVSKLNGERFKISGEGLQPFWRHDGRELYFATLQGDIMAVAVSPGPSFGQPVRLMQPCQSTSPPSAFFVQQGATKFAMTADGQRVLAICGGVSAAEITVALGWQSRLQ